MFVLGGYKSYEWLLVVNGKSLVVLLLLLIHPLDYTYKVTWLYYTQIISYHTCIFCHHITFISVLTVSTMPAVGIIGDQAVDENDNNNILIDNQNVVNQRRRRGRIPARFIE